MSQKEILIIDDDKDLCSLAKKVLESSGYQVKTATSADQGMLIAAERSPHLIITDIRMPQKTGFDFLEMKNGSSNLKFVPVLVMSAIKDKSSVIKALAMGASDYVIKPFQSTILIQKVKKALQDNSFPKKTLSADDKNNTVVLSGKASILSLSEVSFKIESPINLAPFTNVFVESPFLSELNIPVPMYKTSNVSSKFSGQGLYRTDINFVGLTHDTAKALRLALRKLK